MTNINKNNNSGFTIIELLISIAIVGFFATIIMIFLGSIRTVARDDRRQGDLKTFQKAIELYINYNEKVPNPGTPDNINNRWDGAPENLESLLAPFMPAGLPEDPRNGKWIYCYLGDYEYMVAAVLEQDVGLSGDLDNTNWLGANCIASDDGYQLENNVNCSDNNGGTIDSEVGITAFCLGQGHNPPPSPPLP